MVFFIKIYFRLALEAVHRMHEEELLTLQNKLKLLQKQLEKQQKNQMELSINSSEFNDSASASSITNCSDTITINKEENKQK